jgi:hypothetical protein
MITTTITPTLILYTHLLCIRQTDPNSIFFLFFAFRRSLEESYVNVFSIFNTRSQSFIAIRVGFEIPLEYPREFSNDTHTLSLSRHMIKVRTMIFDNLPMNVS